jgi:hypothetical protein
VSIHEYLPLRRVFPADEQSAAVTPELRAVGL